MLRSTNAVKLPTEKKTTFDITVFDDLNLVALDIQDGKIFVPKISNNTISLRGDFPDGIILGYTFKFQIDLPQFYVKKKGRVLSKVGTLLTFLSNVSS